MVRTAKKKAVESSDSISLSQTSDTDVRRLIYGPATFAALSLLLLLAITFIDSRTTHFSSLRELDANATIETERVYSTEEKLELLQSLSSSDVGAVPVTEEEKVRVLESLHTDDIAASISSEEKLKVLQSLSQ